MSEDKSWVSIEQHMCPICGNTFDTNSLVMKQGRTRNEISLQNTLEKYTVTGYDICDDCNEEDKIYIFRAHDKGLTGMCAHITKDNLTEEYQDKKFAIMKEQDFDELFGQLIPNSDS